MKFSKKKGLGNMLSCMVGMLFLFIVVFLGMDIYGRLNLAISKLRIERKYMLIMETDGCLTQDRQEQLTEELKQLGVSGISYTGTTLTPADYGCEVVLSVRGTIFTEGITGLSEGFQFIRGGYSEFKIYQMSTAKNQGGT